MNININSRDTNVFLSGTIIGLGSGFVLWKIYCTFVGIRPIKIQEETSGQLRSYTVSRRPKTYFQSGGITETVNKDSTYTYSTNIDNTITFIF